MLSISRPAKGAMTSIPLAFMAFLLLFDAQLVLAGPVGSHVHCLDATVGLCQSPLSDSAFANCCPPESPVCTSIPRHGYTCVAEATATSSHDSFTVRQTFPTTHDSFTLHQTFPTTHDSFSVHQTFPTTHDHFSVQQTHPTTMTVAVSQHVTSQYLIPPGASVDAEVAARGVSTSVVVVSGHVPPSAQPPTTSTSDVTGDDGPVFTQYPWPTGITYISPTVTDMDSTYVPPVPPASVAARDDPTIGVSTVVVTVTEIITPEPTTTTTLVPLTPSSTSTFDGGIPDGPWLSFLTSGPSTTSSVLEDCYTETYSERSKVMCFPISASSTPSSMTSDIPAVTSAPSMPSSTSEDCEGVWTTHTYSDEGYVLKGCLLTPSPRPTLAARHNALTTISIGGDDVAIVTAQNSVTTFPLALVKNSAAPIPSSCQQYVTTSDQAGTSVFLTYVARDCTIGEPTTTSTTTVFSTTTAISSTILTVSLAATSVLSTISSTSTSTSTSIVSTSAVSTKNDAFVAAESMASAAHSTTTVSVTTSDNVCTDASTVTLTVAQTAATSYITQWLTATTSTSASSSAVLVSGTSSESDTSTSADGVVTLSSETSESTFRSTISTPIVLSMSSTPGTSVVPATPMTPMTPMTPTTPMTPSTPSPTVTTFNGGSSVLGVSQVPGMMVILCLAWFVIFQ